MTFHVFEMQLGINLYDHRNALKMSLVYFVASSQGSIHAQNMYKQREVAFIFFTECLIRVFFFFLMQQQVTQKMA